MFSLKFDVLGQGLKGLGTSVFEGNSPLPLPMALSCKAADETLA